MQQNFFKYICQYCGRSFKSKSTYTLHINVKHLKNTIIKQKRNKIRCINCNRDISISNYNKHYKSCINNKYGNKHKNVKEILDKCIIKNNRYTCPICNKEFSKAGIGTHIYFQHTEDGKIYKQNQIKAYKSGIRVIWNKGHTKETDSRIAKSCRTFQINQLRGLHTNYIGRQNWTNESKQKLRNAAIKRGLGGVRRTKRILYSGFKLGSTYEVELAKDLDANNIKWIVPKRFKYLDLNNKQHYYNPDLYLPDYNIYLDPKNDFLINNINPRLGYKDSDKIKWVCEQNNIKVFILNKDQLSWKYIKENLLNAPLV